jgi:hypothetical protein
MQKRKKTFLIILGALLLTAVALFLLIQRKGPLHADITSSNGARYSVMLPPGFVPAHFNDTLPEMSLQYEDAKRALHVLVIDESKAKIISFGLDYDLDTYMKIATRTLDKDGLYVNKPLTINGYKTLQTDLNLTMKNVKKVYRLTCVETTKYFYQVLVWSDENNFASNKDDIDKIINSFKESIE